METRLERFFDEIEALHMSIDDKVANADPSVDKNALKRHLMMALNEYIRSIAREGELN